MLREKPNGTRTLTATNGNTPMFPGVEGSALARLSATSKIVISDHDSERCIPQAIAIPVTTSNSQITIVSATKRNAVRG